MPNHSIAWYLKTSGIYGFFHRASGKCYVGSAHRLGRRRTAHLSDLRRGASKCIRLQTAWAAYGEGAFTWCIIELVPDKACLLEREQHWIDALHAHTSGYNTSPSAGPHAERATARAAQVNRGRKRPVELLARMQAGYRAMVDSPEGRARFRASMQGYKRPPEQVEAMRERATGVKRSEASKRKQAETNKAIGRILGEKHPDALLNEAQVLEIRQRYAAGGVLQRELAAHYGVDGNTIHNIIRGKTWGHLPGGRAPVKPPSPYPTETQVREIRSRYAAGGIRQSELVALYGFSSATISRIVNRKAWKHVD